MTDETDHSRLESRRSRHSGRRRSVGRRFAHAIGEPLLRLVLFALTSTYRIRLATGSGIERRLLESRGEVFVPVCWHAHQIGGCYLVRDWIRRGFEAGCIISASVDGDVPASMARRWGAQVVRGSAHHTGTLVLRDAVELMRNGVSILTMTDGPVGPKFQVKTGTVLMARLAGAPLVPIVCAASRAWTMNTWDHFLIPKPFAQVVLAVGEPIEVPRNLPLDQLDNLREQLQTAMDTLLEHAQQTLP